MTETYSNTIVTARILVQTCVELGVDRGQLLAAAGAEQALLADPDGQISMQTMRRLWLAAFELSQEPALPLRMAERVQVDSYRLLEPLLAFAESPGAGLERMARYFAITNNWMRVETLVGSSECAVRLSSPAGVLPAPPVQYFFAVLALRGSALWAQHFAPLRLELAAASAAMAPALEAFFTCPVQLDAPQHQMVLPRSSWDARLPSSDAVASNVIEEYAELLLAQLPKHSAVQDSVREAIARSLADGTPSVEGVARQLATSARSLQRRLSEEDVSFGALLDQTREQAAKTYLRDREIQLSEIAFLLGFNEQSSFSRAFKRWTGVTPRAYRKRL